jgi:hypothetical protein
MYHPNFARSIPCGEICGDLPQLVRQQDIVDHPAAKEVTIIGFHMNPLGQELFQNLGAEFLQGLATTCRKTKGITLTDPIIATVNQLDMIPLLTKPRLVARPVRLAPMATMVGSDAVVMVAWKKAFWELCLDNEVSVCSVVTCERDHYFVLRVVYNTRRLKRYALLFSLIGDE